MAFWQNEIEKAQTVLGLDPEEIPPAHVEAWMRQEHRTLNGLSKEQFQEEVFICSELVRRNPEDSKVLADSFGLV